MSEVLRGGYALCLLAVGIGVISLLLPNGDIGDTVRRGSRLLLILFAVRMVFSLAHVDWQESEPLSTPDTAQAEDYVSQRLAQPICEAVEEQVREILTQFGISGGQIRIDCNKGRYGDLSLEHITVILPHEAEEKRASIKRMLLKKFDVFCDVSIEEESNGSE